MKTNRNQPTAQRIFGILIILAMVSGLFSSQGTYPASAQIATESPTLQNNGASELQFFATFEEAVESGLREYEENTNLSFALQIITSTTEDKYGYASVQPVWEDIPVEEQEQFGFLLLAENTVDGWYALAPHIVPNETYNDLLLSFPDLLLDEFDKGYYYQYDTPELTSQAVSGHKLPWQNGHTAILTRRDGTNHGNQLDFDIAAQSGTWHSNSGYVYASKPGTVIYVKEVSPNPPAPECPDDNYWRKANVVVIRHSSNEYSWYYHLAYNSVIVNEGDNVNYGTRIAEEGRTGCTMGNTGIHLHYHISTSIPSLPSRTDPNVAPWPPADTITTVDFQEVAWSSLVNGQPYISQNTAGGGGCSLTSIPSGYNHCADEGGNCNFSGTANVIYGANNCYTAVRSFTNGTACNNNVFGDPISGVQKKCYTNASSPPPSGNWTAQYFNGHDHWWDTNNFNNKMCDRTFSGTGLDRNYGSGAPCGNNVHDNWVAEYNATINFPSGSYVFYAENDDGLKIWVNNSNIMERGGSSGYYPRCPAINLSGNTPIRAILREEGGDAKVKITWSTDTSVCIPPNNFNKSSPSNSATGVSTSPTLSWETSQYAAKYYYCIDTSNNNNCDTGWQDVGTATSKALSGLTPGTTYYWQARANNEGGEKFGNNGTWWSFTTAASQPGAFNKTSPSNGATAQSTSPTLQWGTSSGATSYEYCYDTTNDNACSNWISNGNSTSKILSGLDYSATYYWHVRAKNNGGTIYSNGNSSAAFWSFTTSAAPIPIRVTGVLTADGNWGGKSTFYAGDPLQWVINIENTTGGSLPVELNYRVTDPNGNLVTNWTGTVSVAAGSWNWGLPGTAAGSVGTYQFTGSATYQGNRTQQTTTYTVAPNIKVYIGNAANPAGSYALASGEERRENYNLSGGPVKVESLNGGDIVSAIRLQSYANNTLYSFVETMGVPSGLLSHKYYFPTYNNTWAPLNSQIRFANLNASATTIRVTIGGVNVWEQSVPGLEERRLNFNVSGGPVVIESLDPAKKIVAAIRLQSYANDTLHSFSETMGIANEYVSHKYYFPTYNNTWAPLNSQIRFGNLEATTTRIRVTIGGVNVWEEDVPGLEERRLNFNVSGGPVVVESLDTNKKIVAAIRLQSFANNTLHSFVETMGVPDGLLSHRYLFPTYNNTWAPLNSQVRFGNLNATATTIRVTIGGVNVWEESVPALEERRLNFNVSGGPVIIESLDVNKKIVAAIRLQSYANDTLYSFAETMGIPSAFLSDTYYFPTYNNTWAPLNSQLRFGVP